MDDRAFEQCLFMRRYSGFSQVWLGWMIQLASVALLSSIPSRFQIFSWRVRGTPSTYFLVMTSATEDGDARLCFISDGGATVPTMFAKPVFFSH